MGNLDRFERRAVLFICATGWGKIPIKMFCKSDTYNPTFRRPGFYEMEGSLFLINKKPPILTDERENVKLQKSVLTNRIPAVDDEDREVLYYARHH